MTETSTTTPARWHGASQDAIEHHYDAGNDFYALWLDRSLSYSCALFTDPEMTIDEAQLAKHAYWVDQLALPATGGRLLDVGCGWGAMLQAASTAAPQLSVHGLTLSSAQRAYLGSLDLPVELSSWEDHEPTAPYDAIVSLGAFEHFARNGLSRADRVDRYRSFFDLCHRWLVPSGRLCLQTIALDDQEERTREGLGRFFVEDVFPESSLPRLGEVVEASEEIFRLRALRIDPEHYARTCRAWRARLHASLPAARAIVGDAVVDHYRKMLFLAEREFLVGSATLYRFTFERRDRRLSTAREQYDGQVP